MPPMEEEDRWQQATLWAKSAESDRHGRPKVVSPVVLDVRWIKTRMVTRDAEGHPIELDVTVVLNRQVDPGSIFRLGTIDDWVGTGSGSEEEDDELYETVTYRETVDIRGMDTRRTAGLKRYRDTLPELEDPDPDN